MVSLVIPVYNEKANIRELLTRIHAALNPRYKDYEIVIIDDRSTDGSWEILQSLKSKFQLKTYKKEGKKGKAFSLVEGFEKAKGEILVMIDADLQYPPEAIPSMLEVLEKADVAVANRKNYHHSIIRKAASRTFRFLFGGALFSINTDIQSGLKVMRRQVWETVKFTPKSQWTLDLEFLYRAKEAGFKIQNHDVTFHPRKNGDSKLKLFKTTWEIGTNALLLKTKKIGPQIIPPTRHNSMHGAGVGYKKHKFITHSTLPLKKSALETFTLGQKLTVLIVLLVIVDVYLYLGFLNTAIGLVGMLTAIYFADVLFNAFLITKSLKSPPEISFSDDQLSTINDQRLPKYTVLCPLYKEASVLRQFAQGIEDLDWPKNKLEVLLLLEEDDKETQDAARIFNLPSYFKTVIVPQGNPKTKPKACNYGLHLATGKYLAIYDAEDRPDPLQLKKAYLAFEKFGSKITCFQAKLSYYNKNHNFLTRFFTAEYSLWFGLILPGLQLLNTTIPLGGTSNHFKTADLKKLEGWDPFNVTEDCDLGVRLFKDGYKTAIIDSTTFEEANSQVKNWLRQRSRWIKGYIQTFLVHNRDFAIFLKTHKKHALLFQLIVGGKIAFILINPLMWLTTIAYFVFRGTIGASVEQFFPMPIFYMAAFCLVVGNFLYLYYYMIAVLKHDQFSLVKYVLFIPFYWVLISTAFWIAAYQLIFKPHFWEKTVHGFHLAKLAQDQLKAEIKAQKIEARQRRFAYIHVLTRSGIATGGVLIAASVFGNFFNFAYNAYLGRRLSIEDFGLVSLIGSFLYLSTIPVAALGKTVTHRSAFLFGKYKTPARDFWKIVRKRAFLTGSLITAAWIFGVPTLSQYFNAPSLDPFYLFAPAWVVGLILAVDSGFLSGNLKFAAIAAITFTEPLIRFLLAFTLVETGFPQYVYAAIPFSMFFSLAIAWFFASRIKQDRQVQDRRATTLFPAHFFAGAIGTRISIFAFLSFDLILAKHFLPPKEAGEYALLSLVGKMIFFVASLFSQFMNPLVSKAEGESKKTKHIFYKLFFLSSLASLGTFLAVGYYGYLTVPILLGEKTKSILEFLPIYSFSILCFTTASTIVLFYQVRRKYLFSFVSSLLAVAQLIGIYFYHASLQQIIAVMVATGIGSIIVILSLHLIYQPLATLARNIRDLFDLLFFLPIPDKVKQVSGALNILIFNWRDTKHVWAGGAEVYISEIAKHFVKKGNFVTVFCGNDGQSARSEAIDGVNIVRRGGFYTVYFWAFFYYVFRFRGKYDVIVDSENGIPFFTPLYVRKPIIGLVHHVHQEVFRKYLNLPMALLAQFLEGVAMPFVYKRVKMVTISNSSKQAVEELGLGKKRGISIINPGVDLLKFKASEKTENPTILYLGRLKPYKSIDRLIAAFSQVVKDIPDTTLTVAGEGECRLELEETTKKLGLTNVVKFLGRVSEKAKAELLAKSWIVAQPSKIEGWGITVIEANAAGTPVIASDVPGLRDSVRNPHTGLLITWDNQEKWTDAMVKVIKDENLRKSLENEAQLWSKNFSWGKSSKAFLAAIEEVKK